MKKVLMVSTVVASLLAAAGSASAKTLDCDHLAHDLSSWIRSRPVARMGQYYQYTHSDVTGWFMQESGFDATTANQQDVGDTIENMQFCITYFKDNPNQDGWTISTVLIAALKDALRAQEQKKAEANAPRSGAPSNIDCVTLARNYSKWVMHDIPSSGGSAQHSNQEVHNWFSHELGLNIDSADTNTLRSLYDHLKSCYDYIRQNRVDNSLLIWANTPANTINSILEKRDQEAMQTEGAEVKQRCSDPAFLAQVADLVGTINPPTPLGFKPGKPKEIYDIRVNPMAGRNGAFFSMIGATRNTPSAYIENQCLGRALSDNGEFYVMFGWKTINGKVYLTTAAQYDKPPMYDAAGLPFMPGAR